MNKCWLVLLTGLLCTTLEAQKLRPAKALKRGKSSSSRKLRLGCSLEPASPNGLFWGQTRPTGKLVFKGIANRASPLRVAVNLLDHSGTVISQLWDGEVDNLQGDTFQQNISMPVSRHGIYHIQVSSDALKTRMSFARLEAPAPTWSDSPFGIDLGPLSTEVLSTLPALKQLGAGWVRFPVLWSAVEVAKGKYDFTGLDPSLAALKKHGLRPLVVLQGSNGLYDEGNAPVSKAAVDAFAKFAAAFANRYKAQCSHYDIWERPNGPSWRPEPNARHYTRLLKETDYALKKVQPDCTVLGLSTYGLPSKYIEQFFGPWDGTYLDALSVRPGGFGSSSFYKSVNNLRSSLNVFGAGDYDMWFTGFGPITNSFKRSSAHGLVRTAVSALSRGYVVRLFLSPWQEAVRKRGASYNYGLITAESQPTQAYVEINTLAHLLHKKKFARKLPVSDYVTATEFAGPDGNALVIWASSGWQNLGLKVDTPNVVISDPMGNRSVTPTVQGRLSFPISTAPVFISGYKSVSVAPGLIQWSGRTSLVPGEKTTLTARLPEGIAHPGYEVTAPEGWNATMGKDGLLHLKTPPNASFTTNYLTIRAPSLGNVESRLPITMAELMTLTATSPESGKVTLSFGHPVTLTRSVALKTIFHQAGKEPVEKSSTLSFGPNSTAQRTVTLNPVETAAGHSLAKVVATTTTDREMTRTAPAYSGKTPFYNITPTLDANLTEWRKLKPCLLNQAYNYAGYEEKEWKGEEHFSARFWAGTDDSNFYIAAEVNDSSHSCKWGGQYLQYGDLLKIMFLHAGSYHVYTAAMTDEDVLDNWQFAPTSRKPPGMVTEIIRKADRTYYEVSIPWATIGVKKEQRPALRFALSVQNWRKAENMGWMEWFHGGSYTSLYGPIEWRK
jgi:hypothetical protein